MRVIDCHCHVGMGQFKKQTVDELLHRMDESGVDVSVICPVDEHIAVTNTEGNDTVIRAVRDHPDRLVGLAVASPWWGERAVSELGRALDAGLRGLKMHPSLQGHWVNDEIVDPLMELVREQGGIVYTHSGTPDYSMPFEICDLAVRHPQIDFIMGHSGLVDVFWRQAFDSGILLKLPNMYYDPSHICFLSELKEGIDQIGAAKFTFGSDSPVGSLPLELGKLRQIGLRQDELEQILHGTIEKLLRIS